MCFLSSLCRITEKCGAVSGGIVSWLHFDTLQILSTSSSNNGTCFQGKLIESCKVKMWLAMCLRLMQNFLRKVTVKSTPLNL